MFASSHNAISFREKLVQLLNESTMLVRSMVKNARGSFTGLLIQLSNGFRSPAITKGLCVMPCAQLAKEFDI